MKSLYLDGASPLHRLPARTKLIGLALLGVALFLTDRLPLLGLAAAASGLVFASIGLTAKTAATLLKPLFLTIAVVALFSLAFNPWHDAAATLIRLTALMLAAAAVTVTTTIASFIEEVTRLAWPLEKIGLLQAADVGLAIGLVVRFLPEIMGRYEAIREAHAARGLKIRATSMLLPLIILTLKDADNVAAAIDARRIRGQGISERFVERGG